MQRLIKAAQQYLDNNGEQFFIKITVYKGSYITTLINLKTMTVSTTNIDSNGEPDPSRIFDHIREYGKWDYQTLNQLKTDAIKDLLETNPNQIIESPLRRECCQQSGGYIFIDPVSTLRCITCHNSQGKRSLWELGLTNERPRLSTKRRKRLRERDGDICPLCNTTIIESHIDHKISINYGNINNDISRIYINSDENLRNTCATCNIKKGARSDKSV